MWIEFSYNKAILCSIGLKSQSYVFEYSSNTYQQSKSLATFKRVKFNMNDKKPV